MKILGNVGWDFSEPLEQAPYNRVVKGGPITNHEPIFRQITIHACILWHFSRITYFKLKPQKTAIAKNYSTQVALTGPKFLRSKSRFSQASA